MIEQIFVISLIEKKEYLNMITYSSYALESGKGILVVNKWDTVEDKDNDIKVTKKLRYEFQFLSYAPIVFTSALTKKEFHYAPSRKVNKI